MPPTGEMLLPTETSEAIAERTCARCEMTTTWIPRSKREKVPANWIIKNGQGYREGVVEADPDPGDPGRRPVEALDRGRLQPLGP